MTRLEGTHRNPRDVDDWPALRLDEWTATRETLHMWTQIVGKVRLAKAPMTNHWWQVPLYVTPRGLTTSAVPDGHRSFAIEFDFLSHQLRIDVDDGESRALRLESKTVAQFYRETMDALAQLGVAVSIWTTPREVETAIPFERDDKHHTYNPRHAELFWRQLTQADRVMHVFRAGFVGKVSPVHLFWGALDLACTRFSGRPAPPHPGNGVPNVGAGVMAEGYSHELSSCGFWPGGSAEGSFYSYAYPEPDGFAAYPVSPSDAYYNQGMGEFLLPYEVVRSSADPDATLLEFLHSSYVAAADLGGWDRHALEVDFSHSAGYRR